MTYRQKALRGLTPEHKLETATSLQKHAFLFADKHDDTTHSEPSNNKLEFPPRRLHRKQAAVYLGVSLSWLDKSRVRGDGPVFLQIGTRVVYDTADLDQYLALSRRRSTSGSG